MEWSCKLKNHFGARAPGSPLLNFIFEISKIWFQCFDFFWKKIHGCGQCCILPVCKFLKRNILYFGLSKNDKISQKDKISTSAHCSPLFTDNKILICHFFWAQNRMYFVLKICTLVEYNIDYILVFFRFFETFEFEISKVQKLGYLEPVLQKAALRANSVRVKICKIFWNDWLSKALTCAQGDPGRKVGVQRELWIHPIFSDCHKRNTHDFDAMKN